MTWSLPRFWLFFMRRMSLRSLSIMRETTSCIAACSSAEKVIPRSQALVLLSSMVSGFWVKRRDGRGAFAWPRYPFI